MLNFQGVSSLIRSEPVLRNLISPVNVFSGTYKAVFKDGSTEVDAPRIVIDPKPALGASHKNDKGTLFIVVVGETARLANWGLAGYSRDTTPQLRARNVIPFRKRSPAARVPMSLCLACSAVLVEIATTETEF